METLANTFQGTGASGVHVRGASKYEIARARFIRLSTAGLILPISFLTPRNAAKMVCVLPLTSPSTILLLYSEMELRFVISFDAQIRLAIFKRKGCIYLSHS